MHKIHHQLSLVVYYISMPNINETARNEALWFVARLNEVFLEPLVLLLIAVATLVFLWGGFVYVSNADNEQARSEGRQNMIYGVIGFVIMVAALAILRIFANSLGLDPVLDAVMD